MISFATGARKRHVLGVLVPLVVLATSVQTVETSLANHDPIEDAANFWCPGFTATPGTVPSRIISVWFGKTAAPSPLPPETGFVDPSEAVCATKYTAAAYGDARYIPPGAEVLVVKAYRWPASQENPPELGCLAFRTWVGADCDAPGDVPLVWAWRPADGVSGLPGGWVSQVLPLPAKAVRVYAVAITQGSASNRRGYATLYTRRV